ncbi:MAG TPA: hypothetical protein VLB83_02575 [Candidatus Paceibacterota bacterium]|nr:hypothetical protein [Candidatus Paceibacterota bacterium]
MNRRTLAILGTVIALDAVLAGGLWYASTLMQELKASEKDITQKLARLDSDAERQAIMRRTLGSVEEERKRLDPFFYDSTDESGLDFVKQIEQLGKTSGVALTVNTATFTGTVPNRFRMDLQFTGSWSSVYHFVHLLETFPARLSISRINLTANNNAKDLPPDGVWGGNVSIELLSIRTDTKPK